MGKLILRKNVSVHHQPDKVVVNIAGGEQVVVNTRSKDRHKTKRTEYFREYRRYRRKLEKEAS